MPTFRMHRADSSADRLKRDLGPGLLSAHHDALIEVEEAIRRIENNTYGIGELSALVNLDRSAPHPRHDEEAQFGG